MNLVTWDPARDLGLLPADMSSMFDGLFPTVGASNERCTPAVDIHEEDGQYVVRADLPGMAEDDVSIEVEDGVLHISGERRDEHEDRREGYHRVERSWGRFERSMALPDGVDPDAIRGSFDKGVLELRVPKPEQRSSRRIPIGNGRRDADDGSRSSGGAGKRSLRDRVLRRS